jgi:hypothetical protein
MIRITSGPHASEIPLALIPESILLIGRKWNKTPQGLLSSGLMRSRSVEKLSIELDKEASGVHCALIVYASAVVLFDAGSTNGTTFQRHARADVEACQAAPGETPWIESLHGVRLVMGANFSAGNSSFELLSKPIDELPSKPIDDRESGTAPPFPLAKKKPAAKRPREKGACEGAVATKPAANTAKAAAAASKLDISKLFDEPDPDELKHVFLLAGKARQQAASKRRPPAKAHIVDIDATQAENSQEAAWAGVDHPDPGSCATCAVPPEIATAFQVYRRVKANRATMVQVADSIKALEAAMTIISQARGALAYHLAGGMMIEEVLPPHSDGGENAGAASSSKRPWLSADNGALSQDIGSLPRMAGETPREEAPPEPITDADVVEILASSAEGAEGAAASKEIASPSSENVRKMARDLGLRVEGRRRETLAADVRFALASAEEAADTDIEEKASVPDECATDGVANQLALFIRSVPRFHEAAMLGELRLVHVQEAVSAAGMTIAKEELIHTLSTLGVEIIF